MKKKLLLTALLMTFANQHYALAANSPIKPANFISAEAEVRSFNSTLLYVTPDGSWKVGPDTKNLVNVHYANFSSITDNSFNLVAIDAEKTTGGYILFLENAANGDIYLVNLDATGNAVNYKIMTTGEIYQAETTYNIDLNLNGGIGSEAVLFTTGETNTYLSGDGKYQIGNNATSLQTITVGGQPLTDLLLPDDWEIVDAVSTANGYRIFLIAGKDNVYGANLNSSGQYLGGNVLSAEELQNLEDSTGSDINNDYNFSAPAGWENTLKDSYIRDTLQQTQKTPKNISARAATESAQYDYAAVVNLLKVILEKHQDNSPLTDTEISDLRAIASRGKAAFVSKSSDGAEADYLAYIFDKLVNESVANNFWTGGQGTRVPLGNLTKDTSIDNFKKLVDKWIFGKDIPSTKTAGDSANPKASGAEPKYAQVTGPLFVDGINQADVAQGSSGDCYLVASVLGAADVNSARIKAMIVENTPVDGNRTWGVRFFDDQGKSHWVTINDMLPIDSDETPKLIYGANQEKLTTGELWWPLIEKAYVQANTLQIIGRTGAEISVNAFWAIEGGDSGPLGSISGTAAANLVSITAKYMDPPLSSADLKQAIINALQKNQPVYISSSSETKDAEGKTLFTGGHAFMILNTASNTSEITVRNPWTLSTPGDNYVTPFKVTLDDLANTPNLGFAVGNGY